MTVAICLRCGRTESRHVDPLPRMWVHADEMEDLAKSVLLSDHHLDKGALDNMQSRIKAGETVTFPA